jgi:hypothetical protein
MTRPFYETQENRDNEERARVLMEKAWGLKVTKCPISYGFDFAVFDLKGTLLGCIEYKRRNIDFVEGKTKVILSVLKLMAMRRFVEIKIGLKAKFLIQCNNGFYIAEIKDQADVTFGWGGRFATQRDSADLEPVVTFNASCFQKLDLG